MRDIQLGGLYFTDKSISVVTRFNSINIMIMLEMHVYIAGIVN